MRDVSKKRKWTSKQGSHQVSLMGVMRKGEDASYFRQQGGPLLFPATKKGLRYFLTFTVFLEPRAQVKFNIVTIYPKLPLPLLITTLMVSCVLL